ncbi:RICIN domain-containing protein [Crossiella sp. CA198]|uniref:RICIN domain-containing protein n=1 Tax=Crossiella sp. CA198 TaxID=3455607 RepID=UPI003F8D3322
MRNRTAAAVLAVGTLMTSLGLMTAGTANAAQDFTNVKLVPRHAADANMCMEVVDASTQHAADVRMGNCNGDAHQRWDVNHVGGNVFEIVNRKSGMCLDVAWAHTHSGANVLQANCERRTNQRWWQRETSDGYREFLPTHTGGKCLDVKDASKLHGADVIQSGCWGGNNQQWKAVA